MDRSSSMSFSDMVWQHSNLKRTIVDECEMYNFGNQQSNSMQSTIDDNGKVWRWCKCKQTVLCEEMKVKSIDLRCLSECVWSQLSPTSAPLSAPVCTLPPPSGFNSAQCNTPPAPAPPPDITTCCPLPPRPLL